MTSNHPQAVQQTEESNPEIDHGKAQHGVRLLVETVGEVLGRGGIAGTWRRRVPDAFATLTEGTRASAKSTMRSFEAETSIVTRETIGIPSDYDQQRFADAIPRSEEAQ